jgi:hypothetical protein
MQMRNVLIFCKVKVKTIKEIRDKKVTGIDVPEDV